MLYTVMPFKSVIFFICDKIRVAITQFTGDLYVKENDDVNVANPKEGLFSENLKKHLNENETSHSNIRRRRRRIGKHKFSSQIKKQLRPLYKKNNSRGIIALIEDYLIIGIIISLCITAFKYLPILGACIYPIGIIIIGSRMRALATLLHESSHRVLAKNQKLNYMLGTFCSGYLIFQTFYTYEHSHVIQHHYDIGGETDSDYQYYKSQGLFEMKSLKEFLRLYLIPNLFLLKLPSNLWYLISNRLLPKNFRDQERKAKLEYVSFVAFWLILVGFIIYFDLMLYFLLFWMIPYITTFQIINSIIEVCEHFPIIESGEKDIHVSRNRNGNRFELFFFGIHAENYHLVHHKYAGIPFWNLKKAHAIMLQDEEYKLMDDFSGGIITKSKLGKKTIIKSMFE